jgi:hypothetical protein
MTKNKNLKIQKVKIKNPKSISKNDCEQSEFVMVRESFGYNFKYLTPID